LAHVTVKINGYAYTVGCENGQEQHLLAMATQVENRIDSIIHWILLGESPGCFAGHHSFGSRWRGILHHSSNLA